jgi:hypothetical protein
MREVATLAIGLVLGLNVLVSLFQVTLGHSVGLFSLGEAHLSLGDPGVAKIFLFNEAILRAYGLFPHPNINAFFLFSALLVLFHVPRGTSLPNSEKCSTWNMEGKEIALLWRICLILGVITLILTFSKIFLLLGFLIFLAQMFHVEHRKSQNVPRGTSEAESCSTWNMVERVRVFHVEHRYGAIVGITGVLTLLYLFIHAFQSLSEREELLSLYRGHFEFTFLGSGLSTSVLQKMENLSGLPLWLYEPVHNVYLLVLQEAGLFGLATFLLFFLTLASRMLHVEHRERARVPRGTSGEEACSTWNTYRILLATCLIVFFFDHYAWDIVAGAWSVWIFLGVTYPLIKERG